LILEHCACLGSFAFCSLFFLVSLSFISLSVFLSFHFVLHYPSALCILLHPRFCVWREVWLTSSARQIIWRRVEARYASACDNIVRSRATPAYARSRCATGRTICRPTWGYLGRRSRAWGCLACGFLLFCSSRHLRPFSHLFRAKRCHMALQLHPITSSLLASLLFLCCFIPLFCPIPRSRAWVLFPGTVRVLCPTATCGVYGAAHAIYGVKHYMWGNA
jgi:hypothetical protein